MNAVSKPTTWTRRRMIRLVIGLAIGGAAGYALGGVIQSGLPNAHALGWSDIAAAIIALSLLASAVIMGVASFSPKATGRMIDAESGRAATPAQASFYRQQALVMGLAGAMMAAPVAVVALVDPLPVPVASIVMLGIVAAFLVQTAYNLTVWRRGDEMMRRLIAEVGSVCFWTLQGLLFLWAAAEKLNLAPALSTWDLMTILMGFYLTVSMLMAMRRGFS
jgi:hypothetical protein